MCTVIMKPNEFVTTRWALPRELWGGLASLAMKMRFYPHSNMDGNYPLAIEHGWKTFGAWWLIPLTKSVICLISRLNPLIIGVITCYNLLSKCDHTVGTIVDRNDPIPASLGWVFACLVATVHRY